MNPHIRILLLEDNPVDAELIEHELHRHGLEFDLHRVDSRSAYLVELKLLRPDLILSDFSLPGYNGMSALNDARDHEPDIPFIFISGTIGEERAVEALKTGATDYILKDRLARLGPSVKRALQEAADRKGRRITEERLRITEALFKMISDNVIDLIAVLDTDGRRVYSSPSYRAILGDPRQLLGTDSFQEIHPDDRERIQDLFLETVRTGIGHRAEFRVVGKDGKVHFIESLGQVVRDAEGRVSNVVVVSRDVTEHIQAVKDRESLQEQLRQAQKMESMGTLAGGIAHDFNNVLAIILGYASLLRKYERNPNRLDEVLAAILKAGERGTALVRQLMTFAQKSHILSEPVDVNKVLEEVTGLLTATFPKTITFEKKLAVELPTIVADSAQLHQVVLNLCVNARDAMPQGGRLIFITEVVSGKEIPPGIMQANEGQYVVLRIQDTGMGMDAITRRRIFEPFFTTKERGKGTGLGLSVVYGIVKGHNGAIAVDSELGWGTKFSIYLPVEEVVEASYSEREKPTLDVPGGTETILFVEDEELLITLVQNVLASRGYNVLVARTGREAVEVFRNEKDSIAVVLSDIGLPELDGREAFLRMREYDPHVKGIFATGYLEGDERADILGYGACAIIQKPYSPTELLCAVRAAIDVPVDVGMDPTSLATSIMSKSEARIPSA